MTKKHQCMLLLGACGAIFACAALVPQAYGLAESTASGGSNAQAVHQLGETGSGIDVGLMGLNVYAGHEAFYDKDVNGNPVGSSHAFNYDVTSDDIEQFDHDTWMAGIVASRGGKNYPNDIGAARDCEFHCVRVIADDNNIYLLEGLDKLIDDLGCQVVTTSFAYGGTANGQSIITRVYDYYAFTYDNVVFAHAAGNGATAGVEIAGDAFNGITTGGLIETQPGIYGQVGTVSSIGPTDDGRRKPDIVAPSNQQHVPHSGTTVWDIPVWSNGATSLSVPHTAGVAALLVGLADETADTDDGQNQVIRAVIINSAFPNINDRYGNSTNPVDSNNTWNEHRGYGRINALRAYQLLNTPQVSKGTTISQPKGWSYATVNNPHQQDDYFIVSLKNHRLVLTVTWNRKINSDYSEDIPRFNLDLTVKHSDGTVLFSETDPNDNLEKVDLLLPYADTYTVNLTNPGINKVRSYGLAFELIEPVQADLNLDYGVDEDDFTQLKNNWLQDDPETDAELFEDRTIDFRDFAVLAENWRNSNPAYYSQ